MDATTYLYLQSSLVQAFAAIAGVVAVFLVLRYQELTRLRNEGVRELGSLIQALRHYGAPGPLAELFDRQAISPVDFSLLQKNSVRQRIDDANKRLERYRTEHPEDYSRQLDGVEVFEATLREYERLDSSITSFRRYAIESVRIPIGLSIIFSIFLFWNTSTNQSQLSGWRMLFSIASILAATIAAIYMVRYVGAAFEEKSSENK